MVVVTLARASPGLGGRTESIDAHGYNCLLCGWSGDCRSTPSTCPCRVLPAELHMRGASLCVLSCHMQLVEIPPEGCSWQLCRQRCRWGTASGRPTGRRRRWRRRSRTGSGRCGRPPAPPPRLWPTCRCLPIVPFMTTFFRRRSRRKRPVQEAARTAAEVVADLQGLDLFLQYSLCRKHCFRNRRPPAPPPRSEPTCRFYNSPFQTAFQNERAKQSPSAYSCVI